ncbi:hypothetical protein EDD16DRAFT_442119 [Pisolithus croceorrhizus]|nr:hypothetical protein EDD16DRAFT_442119 [Pisolithus croceorrhizus]KAI6163249.1 hypothetical protein EDD17DRAFT_1572175 [Pisolithus thermaeus]
MLSRFRKGYSVIRDALLDLDSSQLSIDDLKMISKHLPTIEEITRIKEFGDVSRLAKADQYFSEIMTIPRLPQRLECMTFRLRFELDVNEIRPELKTVHDACRELQSSRRFKATLQAILAVGNALNRTTFHGGARGFRLETLLKMKETKTTKRGPDCPTLLHYMARVLIRTDPKLTLFIEELPSVQAAARVSFQYVTQSVCSVVLSYRKVQEEVLFVKKLSSPLPSDKLVEVMEPFLSEISERVKALEQLSDTVASSLRSLYAYYGEPYDTAESLKPEDFFSTICSFSLSLQKAAIDVHNSIAKPAIAAPPSQSPIAAQEAKDKKSSSSEDTQKLPRVVVQNHQRTIARGEVDEIIRTLREGTFNKRVRNNLPQANMIFVDGRKNG